MLPFQASLLISTHFLQIINKHFLTFVKIEVMVCCKNLNKRSLANVREADLQVQAGFYWWVAWKHLCPRAQRFYRWMRLWYQWSPLHSSSSAPLLLWFSCSLHSPPCCYYLASLCSSYKMLPSLSPWESSQQLKKLCNYKLRYPMLNMNINGIYNAKFEEDDENVSKFFVLVLSAFIVFLMVVNNSLHFWLGSDN